MGFKVHRKLSTTRTYQTLFYLISKSLTVFLAVVNKRLITSKSLKKQKSFIFPGSTESLRKLLDAKPDRFKKDQLLPFRDIWEDCFATKPIHFFEKHRVFGQKEGGGSSDVINFYEHSSDSRVFEDVYINGNNFFTKDCFLDVDPWSSPKLDSSYGLLNDVFLGVNKPKLVLGDFRQEQQAEEEVELVVIFGKYPNNYWHFICEYLPKLYQVMPGQIVLIPRELRKDFLGILLRLLNDLSVGYLLQPKCSTRFKKITFIKPSVLYLQDQIFSFHFESILWLSQRLIEIESANHPDRKNDISEVYFFKRKSPRRIINDGPLVRLARRQGYSVVNPANLGIADQIAIFRNAKVIIGYPGANWANAIFAHQNLLVYNIVDKKFSLGSLHHLLASRSNCKLIDVCFKENVIENLARISYIDLDRQGFTINSEEARFILGLISRDFKN